MKRLVCLGLWMRSGIWTGIRMAWVLALVVAGTGCAQVGYYSQAVSGQWGIWARQRPVDAILSDSNTPPLLRGRLSLAMDLREFARKELHLESGGSYRQYADLGRDYVSWTVTAAPEFSLEPKQWWYPVVGRLTYRGFFQEREAKELAEQLRLEGWDVSIGGVTAYSTLGWFSDPLLNTYVFDSDARLADLLFHELAHRRYFVAGDTDFNEAFATAVAAEGVRRWLDRTGNLELLEAVERERERDDAVRAVLMAGRHRLDRLYRSASDSVEARAAKARELERTADEIRALAAEWGSPDVAEAWLRLPLNNARLNDVATYYELVPQFDALLRECCGDLQEWYRRVEAIGALSFAARRTAMADPAARLSSR